MRIWNLAFGSFFLSLALPVLSFAQQATRPSEIADSVVQIVVKYTDEASQKSAIQAVGTGFFVSDTLVATAAHVYWEAGQLLVGKKDGAMFARKVSSSGQKSFLVQISGGRIDNNHDLTTFEFKSDEVKAQWPDFAVRPLTLSKNEAEMGDQVILVGFFQQDPNPLVFVGVVATSASPDNLFFGLQANPGESGCPIVSSTTGEVVAIQLGIIPITVPGSTQPSNSGISRGVRAKFLEALLPSR